MTILDKLIGTLCEQEAVEAANVELAALRRAATDREELRTVAAAVLTEIGAAGLADELDTVKLLRRVLRSTHATAVAHEDKEK